VGFGWGVWVVYWVVYIVFGNRFGSGGGGGGILLDQFVLYGYLPSLG